MAFRELMTFNLIEIIHDIPEPGQPFWKRKANRYILNDLLSETERATRWQALEKRHGELFLKARSLAARINEPEDPKIVASLIMVMKIYGEAPVIEVIDKVTKYSFESGRWEMRYLIGILQHDFIKKNIIK